MRCIYCPNTDPSKFTGVEHVIPQSFGTFGPDTPTLSCVCDECNELYGRTLDIKLSRETIEGISRYRNGIYSKSSRPQKSMDIVLGDDPEVGGAAGVAVAIDGKTGGLYPVPQVRFINQTSGKYENVLEADLKGLDWQGRGLSGENFQIIGRGKEDQERLIAALKEIGINVVIKAELENPFLKAMNRVDGKLPVEVTGTIGRNEVRAMTKILMNYAAKFISPEEVQKPEWNAARKYVRYDSGKLKFRV